MALDGGSGGGGGGGPIGSSNPTGTGGGINYSGDFAFGYSGVISCDNNDVPMLNFTTGGEMVVATWQPFFSGASNTTNNMIWRMNLNDEKVQQVEADSSTDNNETVPLHIIIPPYTTVLLTGRGPNGATDSSVTLTGRVYA
jgi:hypothetical protein